MFLGGASYLAEGILQFLWAPPLQPAPRFLMISIPGGCIYPRSQQPPSFLKQEKVLFGSHNWLMWVCCRVGMYYEDFSLTFEGVKLSRIGI